jgi:hypothetical protein
VNARATVSSAASLVTFALGLAATSGCGKKEPEPAPAPAARAEPETTQSPAPPQVDEAAHRVVFGDRTSHGYLLLLDTPVRPEPPTRDDLVRWVEQAFPEHRDSDEVRLLIELIHTEPAAGARPEALAPDDPGRLTAAVDPKQDLLGLHVELLEVDDDLIPAVAREDDVLLRGLSPQERVSLEGRKWALLLRADYRNMNAVRGLRLLQTLVRIVADHENALVHDPDTLETVGPALFSERRLQGNLGNVADQITVVPFPDPRHAGRARLTTRGMRRFGSVDLELDGLAPDPQVLQRGSDLLLGLAFVMIKAGEFDRSGFAIELEDTVAVHWRDVARAYSGRDGEPPRCADCPEEVLVHLVEREREPQDPREHVVVRVVAPRRTSDAPGHDHVAWVHDAIERMFGSAALE